MRQHPRETILAALAATWLVAVTPARAEKLDPRGWHSEPAAASAVCDGDLRTAWQSAEPQAPGMGVTLDLGRPMLLHRAGLFTGDNLIAMARALVLKTSPDGEHWQVAATFETSHEPDPDLRFNPQVGRYLRLELTGSAGYPWSLAEVDLYGAADPAALDTETVIALPQEPPPPVRWAAEELRYYLSEATGRFVRAAPAATANGHLVIALGPEPTAAERARMAELGEEGYLLARSGDQVRVLSSTPRGVLYGAYELLDRLGVKWLDPTPEGTVIPTEARLDLSYLPLAGRPAFATRHFNGWGLARMPRTWKLWAVRNRINWVGQGDWWYGHFDEYLGEIPLRGRYLYGHYPHSFQRVLPGNLYEQHPDWFPLREGKRVPYEGNSARSLCFCTTAPGAIDYVAGRIIETLKARPGATFSLCPQDGGLWCQCDTCRKLDEPIEYEEFSRQHLVNVSDRYFRFMDTICRRVDRELPGRRVLTIAYADYDQPPQRIEHLASNLMVDVCQYGCSSHGIHECAKNAEMKRRMEGWVQRCSDVGVYDYVFDNWYAQKMPLPYCRAIQSELQWLRTIGVRAYATEGSGSDVAWLYSPWAYWVLARSLWDADRPWQELEQDFFTGYSRDAASPMLA